VAHRAVEGCASAGGLRHLRRHCRADGQVPEAPPQVPEDDAPQVAALHQQRRRHPYTPGVGAGGQQR
jgi:hypothetical protein